MHSPLTPVVIMGVAGCGKTTIGTSLAHRLAVPYVEADDLHPLANVAKMKRGIPLTDDDRQPWLDAIASRIAASTNGVVVSCSALKHRYRDTLRQANPHVWFLHLTLDQATATQRVGERINHFMPPTLVASQYQILEPLHAETGLTVEATQPPEKIINIALAYLRESNDTPGHGSQIIRS